ncbi:tRNA 2-selenouridine(34) synthase MnmH [Verrucomicrobiaceae bacterium R5-34]|uniref:tRNA 2-selenouridine(34) synthase MnmH n=1 Tax=Oceaniferula flava TaxID=2800421 RepID=A0AAE2SA34_9BACT|nr:tRNA 2-selenouridine(34) synthase MnmH [Oceaniferula flavus]MBK1830474.1 tRNA 2-selenouridine(34) synthase MnmH [Verrucomicrobiaceae bacterium R5-34]MBK1854568.1 tRNA 2-selenouridine(34) synthase MnmH [Oceaniferula flavus]MBM1135874.1 tRNA 2-selenouridine(34) synthase MnmH [Oceaniferula flavus]
MKHVETISLPHDLGEFSEIIDVRAPGEYAEDHLPGAINLPVLDDDERKQVGTLYKQDPFAARRLGAALIAANAAKHLSGPLASKDKNYTPLVYCWRGGMRSNSLAYILRSVGWRARIIEGGYKTFRKFITEDLERIFATPGFQLTVLSGPTGVAKTRLLHTLQKASAQVLDLEGLANHRGSVLGLAPETEQPSQKHFESSLWQTVSQFDLSQPVFTEAESNRIGRIHCPPPLWKKLGTGRVVEIKLPIDQRAEFLLDDYPHFTERPELLKPLLSRLTKLRGHEQVTAWHEQVDAGKWQEFVASVLKDHYDLVYRRAGDEKSNYPAPSTTLELTDFTPEQLQLAAQKLIAQSQ